MKPTMREIARATAAYFKITPQDLLGQGRHQRVAWPRQIAMTLCREMSRRSLPDIGNHFGNRDHTTVLHGCKAVLDYAGADDETLQALMTIAAMASGMSIDRNRREQEWALSLHAGQPLVVLSEPDAAPAPPPPSPEAFQVEVRTVPWEQEKGARRVMVPAGRYPIPARQRQDRIRPLLPSALRQPTKAQLTAGRA